MHCTIANNLGANAGGGIRNEFGELFLSHVIFHGNQAMYGGEIFSQAPGEVYIEYTNVPDTMEAINSRGQPLFLDWGPGNIDADPLFVAPEIGDYQLAPGSPCTDTGDPDLVPRKGETDALGQPRLQYCRVDIGGLESPYPRDCNANQVGDVCEVRDGSAADCNTNLVPDECEPASIASSIPPDGAIDARQPYDLDGANPAGWDSIELTMCGELSGLSANDFELAASSNEPSAIENIVIEASTVTVLFDRRVLPRECFTLRHLASGTSVSIASLPGDVSATGTVNGFDVFELVDHFNGEVSLNDWQCDVDRSGRCEPKDILRLIDLLNGADAYEPWILAQLPPCP